MLSALGVSAVSAAFAVLAPAPLQLGPSLTQPEHGFNCGGGKGSGLHLPRSPFLELSAPSPAPPPFPVRSCLPSGRTRHLPVGPPSCVLGFPRFPLACHPPSCRRPVADPATAGLGAFAFPGKLTTDAPGSALVGGVGERGYVSWFPAAGRSDGGPEGWSPSRYPQALSARVTLA